MKLPDIDYAAPVQSNVDDIARVGRAGQRAFGVLEEGLTRYGQAMVKQESEEASADLMTRLSAIDQDLISRRYVTKDELRQEFGPDLEGMDPVVRQRVTEGRDEIPTYEVAGAIFDKRAKEALGAASQRVSMSGWRSEFQAAAQADILQRKNRLALLQTKAMDADLRARKEATIAEFARAGAYSFAIGAAQDSTVHSPEEREKMVAFVERARQEQPLEERALMGVESTQDVLEAGRLIQRLESGDGFDRLDTKERTEWKRRLEADVKHFESLSKAAVEHKFAASDEEARNALLTAYMNRGGAPLSMKLAPRPGTVSADTLQWGIRLIESTRPGAKEQETDLPTYSKLTQLAGSNPQAFKNADLSPYFEKLSVPDAKHFLDLQRTLKEKGPLDPQYTSFVGPQEEVNRRLIADGYHVTGKQGDVEKDGQAVGYVQREVNMALWHATQAKAGAGRGSSLDLDERDAVIAKAYATAVSDMTRVKQGKGVGGAMARAETRMELQLGGGPEVPDEYLGPLRQVAAKRGGTDVGSLEKTWTGYQAAAPGIMESWDKLGGGRALTPQVALEVYDLLDRERGRIAEALQKAGRDASEASIVSAAVRGYLGGAR